jgi:hypothetical protein
MQIVSRARAVRACSRRSRYLHECLVTERRPTCELRRSLARGCAKHHRGTATLVESSAPADTAAVREKHLVPPRAVRISRPRFPALGSSPRFPALGSSPRFPALGSSPRFPALGSSPRFPALGSSLCAEPAAARTPRGSSSRCTRSPQAREQGDLTASTRDAREDATCRAPATVPPGRREVAARVPTVPPRPENVRKWSARSRYSVSRFRSPGSGRARSCGRRVCRRRGSIARPGSRAGVRRATPSGL